MYTLGQNFTELTKDFLHIKTSPVKVEITLTCVIINGKLTQLKSDETYNKLKEIFELPDGLTNIVIKAEANGVATAVFTVNLKRK